MVALLTRGANSTTRGSSQRRSPGFQRSHAGPRLIPVNKQDAIIGSCI